MSPDGTTIKIRQKAWRGEVHNYVKTSNGKREIDLHSSVGAMLRKYIGERKSGLLFRSKAGRPLRQSNLYSQLESNIQFRKEVAERVGLGFTLPSKKAVVGPNGPKRTETPGVQLAASA